MTGELVIDSAPGEVRAALLENGTLMEFSVFRRGDGPRLGDLFLGRVTRVERGLDAAFVDIGTGPAGFLPLHGKARNTGEGTAIAVRIAAESVFGKGPRLAAVKPDEIKAAKSAKPPMSLRRDSDLVAAALAAFSGRPPGTIIAADAATLARLRALGAKTDWADRIAAHAGSTPAFAELEIEAQLDDALAPHVPLASGIELHVGELEALTAIDVNAAAFAPRKGARGSALAANLAAVPDIARHIRLRNLSGLILIDFPRMRAAPERKRLMDAVKRALAADPVPSHMHGFTRAGLMEITRERRRRPLSQALLDAPPAPRKSAETVAREALRAVPALSRPGRGVSLRAAPDVVAWLEGPGRPDLAAAEAALHLPLALVPEPGYPRERFEVVPQ